MEFIDKVLSLPFERRINRNLYTSVFISLLCFLINLNKVHAQSISLVNGAPCQNTDMVFVLQGNCSSGVSWTVTNDGKITSGQGTSTIHVYWPSSTSATINAYASCTNYQGITSNNSYSYSINVSSSAAPSLSNAGPDQTGSTTCGLSTVTLAANNPTVGIGSWSVVSGTSGSFENSSRATSRFSGTAGSSYTLRWSISNGPCTYASVDDVIVTFNQNPTIANAGSDQNICGATIANLSANSPTIGVGNWSVVSGSGGSFGNLASPNATFNNATFNGVAGTTYTLRWTISNSLCTSSTDDVNITFTPRSSYTVQFNPPGTICSSAAKAPVSVNVSNVNGPVGNFTYKWFLNTSQSPTATTNVPYFTYPSVANGNTVYCKVTSDYGCAIGELTTNVVALNMTSSVDPTISIQFLRPEYCPDETITLTANSPYITGSSTFIWKVGDGINGAQFSTTNPATILASSTSNVGLFSNGKVITVEVTGLSGTCLATTAKQGSTNGTNPKVSILPDAYAQSQTICTGTSTSMSISNPNDVPGTTYTWTASSINNVTGASNGSGATIAQTLTNQNGATDGSVTYTIYPFSANGCAGTPTTATVTVKPLPSASNAGPDQTGSTTCGLGTVTLAANNPTVGVGSWSVVNGTSGSFENSSSAASRFSGTSGSSYTLRWSISNGPCTYASVDDVIITFNQNPTIANAGSDQSICGSTIANLSANSPTIGAGNWSVVTGSGGSFGNVTSPTATFNGVAGTTYTLRWTISNSPCASSADDVIINFQPQFSYSAQLNGSSVVCSSATTLDLVATASGSYGNLSYQWYINDNSPQWGGNRITVSATSGNRIYCKIYSDGCSAGPVSTSTYVVNLTTSITPTASIQLLKKAYCVGETINFKAVASHPGNRYTWQLNGNLIPTPTNTDQVSLTASETVGTSFYNGSVVTVKVEGISGECFASNEATGTTAGSGIIVNKIPSASAADQSVCNGGSTSIAITNPNWVSGTTYAYVPTSTNTTGALSGSGESIAQPLSLINGSSNGTVTYSITPSANGCIGNTINATVTVKPIPTVTSILNPPAMCSGLTFNYTPTSSISGSTFNWSRAVVSGISQSAKSGVGAINEMLTNTTTTSKNVTYVLYATANGCVGAPFSVIVNVKPKPALTSSLNPSGICSSTAFAYTPTSSVTGSSFNWSRAAVAGITEPAKSSTVSINEVLTNTSTNSIVVAYKIYPTASSCVGATSTVNVTVKPKPVITSSLVQGAICSGTEFSYNPTSSIVGSTFNWSRAAISGISEPSSSGSARISENLTNNLDASVNVIYMLSATSNSCPSVSVSVVVVVNPSPALNSSRNVGPIASSSSFDYAPTSATIGTTFTWSRALISGITQQANGGTGNVNEALTNTTANPLNVTYLFSGTANGCTGPTSSVIVTVNPMLNNYNYIITRDMQSDKKADGSVITVGDVASLPVHLKAENTTYFDGLGRPMQSVATQASPSRLDIVTPVVYDAFGREKFKFLPIVTGSDGYYKPNETMVDPVNGGYINTAASFYGQANSAIASDPRPFSETIYEPSPLNRPAKQFGPGVAWKDHRDPDNPVEKPITKNYLINVLNEVYLFGYDATTGLITWAGANSAAGFYDAGQLYANKTIDEQGHEVIEYVDKEGRTICKKVEASGSGSSKVYASTYYIYDDLGNLAVVLPPEGVAEITK